MAKCAMLCAGASTMCGQGQKAGLYLQIWIRHDPSSNLRRLEGPVLRMEEASEIPLDAERFDSQLSMLETHELFVSCRKRKPASMC